MTEKPLVSIIVPCYNVENYLDACVTSVINQDYKNWECILINDGSTDKTFEIIKTYGLVDSRIKVLTQENAGLSATRNRGIDIADGDFIFFLDSDDILTDDAITSLVSSYQNNDIVTGITTSSTIVDNQINRLSSLLHPSEGDINFENTQYEVIIRNMETGLTPVAQNRLYKSDFIKKNNLRFKNKILHEDELWFFETMLLAKNVKFINQETYFYRIDNLNSITKNLGDRNLESYIQVMEEILNQYSIKKDYEIISNYYAVYIKKIFLDFAIREQDKLSSEIISRLEAALKTNYKPLGKQRILSKNNDLYYRSLNVLSRHDFSIIKKYFFRNPINSLRKIIKTYKILYSLK